MVSPTQDFSARNLGWMRRYRRQFGLTPDAGSLPRKKPEWNLFLKNLEARVASEQFDFRRLSLSTISKNGKQRQVVATSSLDEVLVLRRMNENIRRSYGIKNPNRSTLIRTLRQALGESTQKNVFRLDIKSCFESIPRHAVHKKLVTDGLVSFQTVSLLSTLFDSLDRMPGRMARKGLPRGLAISSTLAEIVLTQLERQIKSVPGVYLVLRYVDDLVIVTTDLSTEIEARVKSIAKDHRLRLNIRKSSLTKIACECDAGCAHGDFCKCKRICGCEGAAVSLEYLGYSLTLSNRNEHAKNNVVVVRLSGGKIRKIKTRIILASRDYIRSGSFDMYSLRLRYLVGNLQMMDSDGTRGLSVGLAYTHVSYGIAECDEQQLSGDLHLLDNFLWNSVRFSLKLRPAPAGREKELYKYSYISGFHSRRRVKLKAGEISQVNECWRHA